MKTITAYEDGRIKVSTTACKHFSVLECYKTDAVLNDHVKQKNTLAIAKVTYDMQFEVAPRSSLQRTHTAVSKTYALDVFIRYGNMVT